MDSPLSTLGFLIFGITFSIYSVIAESQPPSTPVSQPHPPPRPPPPPQSPPRPFPPYTPPPLLSPHSSPLTSPPPRYPPPPRPPRFSPPLKLDHENPKRKRKTPPANHNSDRHGPPSRPPSSPSQRMNVGKKIGLLFAGIAGIMQIGVVGFLVFKRRQLLRTKDSFEASA